MTDLYTDERKFLHVIIDDIDIKVAVRIVGSALEFKVKDPSVIARLQRDIVLAPLSDIIALIEKVDKIG